jgi:hypothetical protein
MEVMLPFTTETEKTFKVKENTPFLSVLPQHTQGWDTTVIET